MQKEFLSNRGLPLPLGRGVCETKSKNERARDRKPFIHRVYSAQRGFGTMVSDRPWIGVDPSLLSLSKLFHLGGGVFWVGCLPLSFRCQRSLTKIPRRRYAINGAWDAPGSEPTCLCLFRCKCARQQSVRFAGSCLLLR